MSKDNVGCVCECLEIVDYAEGVNVLLSVLSPVPKFISYGRYGFCYIFRFRHCREDARRSHRRRGATYYDADECDPLD
jgi:hypothetical protein